MFCTQTKVSIKLMFVYFITAFLHKNFKLFTVFIHVGIFIIINMLDIALQTYKKK